MLIRKRHFSPVIILMLLTGVQTQHGVTFSSQSLCVVTGSTVKIPCTFRPDYSDTQRQWYRVRSSKGEQQDLSKDPQYSGRVSVSSQWNNCDLTVSNVRVSDSGVYNFRFKTQRSNWISASSRVQLTVTDFQVTVTPSVLKSYLSCITTCTLYNYPTYIWFKNGKPVPDQDRKYLYYKTEDAGSYSCSVRGYEEHRSPAVCVYDEEKCWSVTYSNLDICSLIGSSVDLHSYYTFPNNYKVTNVFWFINEQAGVEPVDMRQDEEYEGRVQYTQNSQNNCSLRITNLRERDSQTYRFRFYTDQPSGKYTGRTGVTLSVTDLKVTVSEENRQGKKLRCITTCTLSNNPTYIWYKNGQRVSDCYSSTCSVSVVSGPVSYSCAVKGHDSLLSPPVYSPKNTRAVVLPSGDTVEGDSVTLSCSSDANPPVLTFTWFKQTAAADTLLTTDQNYSITNIRTNHSGLYYCTAHNLLGHHTSTPTHLDVLYSPKNTRAVVLPSGDTVEGDSVTLSCSSDANPPALNFTWFKQTATTDTLLTTGQNYSITNIRTNHSGLYYCTAHNQLGHHNSTPTHLDVLYPPRNLSVNVVPFTSGDFVTLKCTSDSNPMSSYSWYKKTERDVILAGNGTNLTLSSGEDGFYYCTSINRFGSSNSSEWKYTSDNRIKYAVSGFTVALVLSFVGIFLWLRYSNRRRPSAVGIRSTGESRNDSAPVYGNTSAMTSDSTQTASSEDQDNVQYASVYFKPSHTEDVPLYSTVQLAKARYQEDEVEYATVSLVTPRAVREDEIYSNLKSKE